MEYDECNFFLSKDYASNMKNPSCAGQVRSSRLIDYGLAICRTCLKTSKIEHRFEIFPMKEKYEEIKKLPECNESALLLASIRGL